MRSHPDACHNCCRKFSTSNTASRRVRCPECGVQVCGECVFLDMKRNSQRPLLVCAHCKSASFILACDESLPADFLHQAYLPLLMNLAARAEGAALHLGCKKGAEALRHIKMVDEARDCDPRLRERSLRALVDAAVRAQNLVSQTVYSSFFDKDPLRRSDQVLLQWPREEIANSSLRRRLRRDGRFWFLDCLVSSVSKCRLRYYADPAATPARDVLAYARKGFVQVALWICEETMGAERTLRLCPGVPLDPALVRAMTEEEDSVHRRLIKINQRLTRGLAPSPWREEAPRES